MNRRQADIGAVAVIGAVLLLGFLSALDAYQAQRSTDNMMGHMNGYGPDPVWYILGTILVAGVLAGVYVVARTAVFSDDSAPETQSGTAAVPESESRSSEISNEQKSRVETDQGTREESRPQREILDVLPTDERRILEPVIESPGLTQIELRDRADFSKSKVSQTVTDLEKRGLLYREPQGRTYRIYPSDELDEQ